MIVATNLLERNTRRGELHGPLLFDDLQPSFIGGDEPPLAPVSKSEIDAIIGARASHLGRFVIDKNRPARSIPNCARRSRRFSATLLLPAWFWMPPDEARLIAASVADAASAT